MDSPIWSKLNAKQQQAVEAYERLGNESAAARDGYSAKANYRAKRATVATIYDSYLGKLDRFEISPSMLEKKKQCREVG